MALLQVNGIANEKNTNMLNKKDYPHALGPDRIQNQDGITTNCYPCLRDFIGIYMQLTVKAFAKNKKSHSVHMEIVAASWAFA